MKALECGDLSPLSPGGLPTGSNGEGPMRAAMAPVDEGRRQVADGRKRRRVLAVQGKPLALPGVPGFQGGQRQGGRAGGLHEVSQTPTATAVAIC